MAVVVELLLRVLAAGAADADADVVVVSIYIKRIIYMEETMINIDLHTIAMHIHSFIRENKNTRLPRARNDL